MSTLAIRHDRERGVETFTIVRRWHDLSGTDCETLAAIDRTLAVALVDRGLIIRMSDVPGLNGRPGIVLSDSIHGEIRADVADPTTRMAEFQSSSLSLAAEVLGDLRRTGIGWIGSPPQEFQGR